MISELSREAIAAHPSPVGDSLGSSARWHSFTVRLAFLVYLVFQVNAIAHHGSWGQDFEGHRHWIAEAAANPWKFTLATDRPEPPLFYYTAVVIGRMTRNIHTLEIIAIFSLFLNAGALLVFYRLLQILVSSRLLQLAGLIFVLFLPVFMIHAIVLASDAFTMPLFIGMLYFLVQLGKEDSSPRSRHHIIWLVVLLVLSIGTKFTFVSQALAIILSTILFWWTGRITARLAVASVTVFVLVLLAGLGIIAHSRKSIMIYVPGHEMNWTDILVPHRHDLHVLSAPPYDEPARVNGASNTIPAEGPLELLRPHRYSFPALAHLGMFTDILNIYQYDPSDTYFGTRSHVNQSRMHLAVRTGLLFSLAGAILTLWNGFNSFRRVVFQKLPGEAVLVAIAIAGFGWLANVVVFLPKVEAYTAGFWLPRLYVPALLAFALLSFIAFNRLTAHRSPWWQRATLCAVVLQSVVQLSFLWPWGTMH